MKKYVLAIVFGTVVGCFGSISCNPKSKVPDTLDTGEQVYLADTDGSVSLSVIKPDPDPKLTEIQCLPDAN